MRDTEFYEALLGLSDPWKVSKVWFQVELPRMPRESKHIRSQRRACMAPSQYVPIWDLHSLSTAPG